MLFFSLSRLPSEGSLFLFLLFFRSGGGFSDFITGETLIFIYFYLFIYFASMRMPWLWCRMSSNIYSKSKRERKSKISTFVSLFYAGKKNLIKSIDTADTRVRLSPGAGAVTLLCQQREWAKGLRIRPFLGFGGGEGWKRVDGSVIIIMLTPDGFILSPPSYYYFFLLLKFFLVF